MHRGTWISVRQVPRLQFQNAGTLGAYTGCQKYTVGTPVVHLALQAQARGLLLQLEDALLGLDL